MKATDELESMVTSSMTYLTGAEVIVNLDWDSKVFYAWLEPSSVFEDFCEEINRPDLLNDLETDIQKIGVKRFGTLEAVNDFCESLCGDDSPAGFYDDDLTGICGF